MGKNEEERMLPMMADDADKQADDSSSEGTKPHPNRMPTTTFEHEFQHRVCIELPMAISWSPYPAGVRWLRPRYS